GLVRPAPAGGPGPAARRLRGVRRPAPGHRAGRDTRLRGAPLPAAIPDCEVPRYRPPGPARDARPAMPGLRCPGRPAAAIPGRGTRHTRRPESPDRPLQVDNDSLDAIFFAVVPVWSSMS